jgi:hypothetical protein
MKIRRKRYVLEIGSADHKHEILTQTQVIKLKNSYLQKTRRADEAEDE